jgi:hypothetical protein
MELIIAITLSTFFISIGLALISSALKNVMCSILSVVLLLTTLYILISSAIAIRGW